MCGGTVNESYSPEQRCGLSPRVRGNPAGRAYPLQSCRSIPACAGEPAPQLDKTLRHTVYPRVCGGTCFPRGLLRGDDGLSPRVRGNLWVGEVEPSGVGSIPACAGEPELPALRVKDTRVYPRVCGGTSATRALTGWVWGLSPRVRGNPHPPRAHCHHGRSIPACAGEPPASPVPRPPKPVYPRVCGGTR